MCYFGVMFFGHAPLNLAVESLFSMDVIVLRFNDGYLFNLNKINFCV